MIDTIADQFFIIDYESNRIAVSIAVSVWWWLVNSFIRI